MTTTTQPGESDDGRSDREVLREMALDDRKHAQPVYREVYRRRYGVDPEEDA